MTPGGIEPTTFRFVVQRLNHCATAVPLQVAGGWTKLLIFQKLHDLYTSPNIVRVVRFIRRIKVKVKCTLVQALRLCTGRTAHRDVEL